MVKKMFFLVWRKFWVLSWFDFRRSFGVEFLLFGSSLDSFESGMIAFNIQNGCSWFMNFRLRFSLINSVDWDNYFVFNSTNSKIEINAGVYEVPVSILNLELPFSNSAASLVQRWVQTCSSSSAISFEDQVF